MATPSAAVIDVLNSLLEAEANSIFHFVGAGSPFVSGASPEVRQALEHMRRHLDVNEEEIFGLIRHLGGTPSQPPKPSADDQYLSFLSLRFLMPKLVDAKKLMIQRYENALLAIGDNAQVTPILQRHLVAVQGALVTLQGIAARVTGRNQENS